MLIQTFNHDAVSIIYAIKMNAMLRTWTSGLMCAMLVMVRYAADRFKDIFHALHRHFYLLSISMLFSYLFYLLFLLVNFLSVPSKRNRPNASTFY